MNDQLTAKTWLDRFLENYYRDAPVNATFIGIHEFDSLLPDCSESGLATIEERGHRLLSYLGSLDTRAISNTERMDLELAAGHLEIQQWEIGSRHFQRGNPAYYTGEAVFGVLSHFLRDFGSLDGRLYHAADRMCAIPVLLEQARANVPVAHPAWNERAISDCNGALEFLTTGIDYIDHRGRLARPAETAKQAFREHREFLESSHASDESVSVAAGDEAFDLLLKQGHFLDDDAGEILRRAEAQMHESEASLTEQAPEHGDRDWQTVLRRLMDDHPDVGGYYRSYQEVWEECRETAESHGLVSWPDYPIRYVPRPAWSQAAAPFLYFLFYRSPAPFDTVPVVDYLVTPVEASMPDDEQRRLLRANNSSVIKMNHVVHHGSIGHHVQNWYAFRAASRIGNIAAVDCASRIAMFCGGTMAEGWSSYATELMGEVGFLTPLERYSQHYARMRMAARAIVDIRLHRGDMSLSEAAAFYEQRVGMSETAALDEAVKNSMFPGAALMYLVGADMIHDLRRDLVSGSAHGMPLRAFHDQFLSYGSVPVSLIARSMRSARAQ